MFTRAVRSSIAISIRAFNLGYELQPGTKTCALYFPWFPIEEDNRPRFESVREFLPDAAQRIPEDAVVLQHLGRGVVPLVIVGAEVPITPWGAAHDRELD